MTALWMRLLAEVAAGVLLALLLRRFVCLLAYVKGSSMRDTLENGEVMFAACYGLFGRVKRFDVVICRYPGRRGLFVKRVIGLPGERISMTLDVVSINGEALEESFARRKCLRAFPEVQLGTDEYFVMGDNRPISRDSRRIGAISRSAIRAHACAVIWPPRCIRKIH